MTTADVHVTAWDQTACVWQCGLDERMALPGVSVGVVSSDNG